MKLRLVRTSVIESGAYGVLHREDGTPFILTLEHTYEGLFVKIPDGVYTCRRTHFIAGGYDTYEICEVPGCARILFHIGNWESNSNGCVLVGTSFEIIVDRPGVSASSQAFREFMHVVGLEQEFQLVVKTVV